MQHETENYVSVIALSLLQPIVCLLERLDAIEVREPGEVQASTGTNGYSVAVVLLSVVLLESFLQRTQYVKGEQPPERSAKKFFKDHFPESGLSEELVEVFVVRDAIAHGYIWEANVTWDDRGKLHLNSSRLRDEYGSPDFHAVRDERTNTTRKLYLNLFPPRIWHRDAAVVLQTVLRILRFLEDTCREYVYVSQQVVSFRGEIVYLMDLVKCLGQTWVHGIQLGSVANVDKARL